MPTVLRSREINHHFLFNYSGFCAPFPVTNDETINFLSFRRLYRRIYNPLFFYHTRTHSFSFSLTRPLSICLSDYLPEPEIFRYKGNRERKAFEISLATIWDICLEANELHIYSPNTSRSNDNNSAQISKFRHMNTIGDRDGSLRTLGYGETHWRFILLHFIYLA